jgi:hypothetical protein
VTLSRNANGPEREYFITQNNDDDCNDDNNTMGIVTDEFSWRYSRVLRDTELRMY